VPLLLYYGKSDVGKKPYSNASEWLRTFPSISAKRRKERVENGTQYRCEGGGHPEFERGGWGRPHPTGGVQAFSYEKRYPEEWRSVQISPGFIRFRVRSKEKIRSSSKEAKIRRGISQVRRRMREVSAPYLQRGGAWNSGLNDRKV